MIWSSPTSLRSVKVSRKRGYNRGATDGALVDINKVLESRTIKKPDLKTDGKSEYVIGVDVARSQSGSNNQTSISILKLKRNADGRIIQIPLVNLINLPNGLNFSQQAIEVKRIQRLYQAKAVVVDINTLGMGLLDELMKETIDPDTGENLGCWDTLNTDHIPESSNANKIIYGLTSQGINHDIIVNFIDMVESKKLQLLEKSQDKDYDVNDTEYIENKIMPHIQTDLFVEEISNLKIKELQSGRLTVEQVTKRVDKDRYSSVAMALYYIKKYESSYTDDDLSNAYYIRFN